MEETIKQVYTDLNSPAAFSSQANVYKVAKSIDPNITKKDVENVLETSKSYTLHKPRRTRFKRLKTVPIDFMTNMQADLADFQKVAKHNDGYRYLLVTIDVLSRRIFVAPVKSKSPKDMISAFDKVFEQTPDIPQYLFTDKGLEFQAREMMNYFKKKDIQKHTAQSPDVKAAIAERCIRTLKNRLYRYFTENLTLRWVDVIDNIVEAYNNTVHKTTKMRPIDVTTENSQELWERMYGDMYKPTQKPKYKEGDTVRISMEKKAFEKGYMPHFSNEIFTVDAVKTSKDPPNYRIVDKKGEEIIGKFYNEEFSKYTPTPEEQLSSHRIDKILKTRMRRGRTEYLVKWEGKSEKEATWVRIK